MSLTSAGDLLKGLGVLEGKLRFVKCPFCDDEVTKLRPCEYWQGEEQRRSFVCIECAETVKGLTYLAGQYPIPGVDVIAVLHPVYKKLDTKFVTEHSYMAHVTYGNWTYMVWRKGNRLAVLEKNDSPENQKDYDNTFQVWFAIKSNFEKSPDKEEVFFNRKSERRKNWVIK